MNEPPTRLCCGQKHYGPICPDGKIMCCICFGKFDISQLSLDKESGFPCDVCKECKAHEDKIMESKE